MGKLDYKMVLEDLRLQKAEIEKMIAHYERLIGSGREFSGGATKGHEAEITVDTFTGKNILQASEKYLQMVGRPARSTEEIAERLAQGGLTTTAGSVATILGRSRNSAIKRVKRGLWGLKEWYES